jgi:hypothetical protein
MKINLSILILCILALIIVGCSSQQGSSTTNQSNPTAVENPASVKCVADGGADKILFAPDGSQYGLCLFPDGSVCEEWAYYNGKCAKGDCFRKCGAIGTRSEGWYDCNGKLLFWDNCANESAKTAGTC